MSQTPRKFSEKIAILERKTKAESDDFMSIMSDVKKITSTTSGRSPQTTPSSTPYPCSPTGGPGSSSANHTPSATESPVGLMPDSNNLNVMHPLAGMMPWQRPGGSLPNVHAMVQQKPGMMPQMSGDQYQNWLYWQSMQAQTSAGNGPQNNHHPRTRSPGSSAHYHPYRSSSGNVAAAANAHGGHRNERIPPLESHMMSNNVHLQPPDPSWSNNRARSDPAIHMNTMNALYYNSQPGAQFSQQYQQQQANMNATGQQFQQQQWAQMNNGTGQGQQFYTNGPTCTTPTGTGPTPQTPNSQPGSTASSASSVPISMASPQNQPGSVQQQQIQYNGGYLKQSPCGSPDMNVGSLPNMHSPMLNQQQFKNDPSSNQQNYYDYDYNSPQQQQPLQSAPPTMQNPYCNGGSVYAYNQMSPQQTGISQQQQQQQQYIRPQHQLTMPQGMGTDSSQSAPTSPAQSYTNNPLQPQWTPTRHYSASPDNMGGIPRVTLTRVEGNTECFQEEFQDLCLDVDNDLQQVLMQGGEDHFDPATETQLINSTR